MTSPVSRGVTVALIPSEPTVRRMRWRSAEGHRAGRADIGGGSGGRPSLGAGARGTGPSARCAFEWPQRRRRHVMPHSTLHPLDHAVQNTSEWLADVAAEFE